VSRLLQVVFTGRRNSGKVDLEAVEMLVRTSMHRAGAAALEHLLSMPSPEPEQVTCGCGHSAKRHGRRVKQIMTALGQVRFGRGYYLCPHCHQGHSPLDRELDVEGVACSPGVRRMMAVVGSDASFQQGREQLQFLAGVEVTAKAVERHAEAIGADVEAGTQEEIRQAKQLELPAICAPAAPILYVEMDGTGVPVVKAETEGRAGKAEGQPAHTREVKLGCVFTQTGVDEEGRPVRDEDSTSYVAAIETAGAFGLRLYNEACGVVGAGRRTKSCLATAPSGSGTSPTSAFQAPSKSWISSMPASTCGNSRPSCSPRTRKVASAGWLAVWIDWNEARSKRWSRCSASRRRPAQYSLES